jgi:hypothetical protein
VRVSLSETHAVSGTPISGTVTVINSTGHALTAGLVCPGGVFAVALSNSQFPVAVAFAAVGCKHPYTIPTGITTQAVTVMTTYPTLAGELSLPAGSYRAGLLVNEFAIPIPVPIRVSLPPGSGPAAAPPAASPPGTAGNQPPPTVPASR